MSDQPFFERVGAEYRVNRIAAGPWDPNSLHGRVVVGLLAHAIEAEHGSAEFLPARLTVDMYRLPGFDAVEVKTRIVRDGKRIKVIDAEFFSGGVSMARATSQLLRRTQNAPGKVWTPPNWDAPPPEAIDIPPERRSALGGMWEIRPIAGMMGTHGTRRLWMRERRALVGGEALTPFVRAALAADFASPFANAGDQGLGYINSDATLYLHRAVKGEWVGMEVTNHHATDGVAIGECAVYDIEGPVGTATVAALAQRRNM